MTIAEKNAYRIPEDHRIFLIEHKDSLLQLSYLSKDDVVTRYFFELFNRYMCVGCNDTPDCGYCCQKVLKRIKDCIKTYEKYGINGNANV